MAKGLLIQRKGPVGTVMTPEGRFIRVFLRNGSYSLGQEVQGIEIKFPSFIQGVVAAAVLLVMVVGIWSNLLANPAAAYVALDINPSLELTVNSSGKVIKVVGLDEDGQQLLKQVTPKDKELYQAVGLLVQGAAKYHYLNETNNVVLTTVTPAVEAETVVDKEKLQSVVQQTVATLPIQVKIVTEQASLEEHEQASQRGVSVGRYLIHKNSTKQGQVITLDEVKHTGLGQLEKEKGIQIELVLPNAKCQVKSKNAKKAEIKSDNKKTQTETVIEQGQKSNSNNIKVMSPGQSKKNNQAEQNNTSVDIKESTPSNDKDDGEHDNDNAERRESRRPSQLSPGQEMQTDISTDKGQDKIHDKTPSQKKFHQHEDNGKNQKEKN